MSKQLHKLDYQPAPACGEDVDRYFSIIPTALVALVAVIVTCLLVNVFIDMLGSPRIRAVTDRWIGWFAVVLWILTTCGMIYRRRRRPCAAARRRPGPIRLDH